MRKKTKSAREVLHPTSKINLPKIPRNTFRQETCRRTAPPTHVTLLFLFQARSKNCEKRLLTSSYLAVRLFARVEQLGLLAFLLCVCVCVCITYVRIYTTHRAAEIQQTSSVVGKQVGYGMDGPGLESRWGQAFSPFSTTSRPALGLSNAYRSSLPGIKRPRHEVNLHLVPMLRMNGPIRLLPLYAFMASTKMTFTIIRRNHPTVKN